VLQLFKGWAKPQALPAARLPPASTVRHAIRAQLLAQLWEREEHDIASKGCIQR
jgi:hypothetical protein